MRSTDDLDCGRAMVAAFHLDATGPPGVHPMWQPHLIMLLPSTRRELDALRAAVGDPDPLPPAQAATRWLLTDLIARHRTLHATPEPLLDTADGPIGDRAVVRRAVADHSTGATLLLWATHWLPTLDADRLRPDTDHRRDRQTRRRNEAVAKRWGNPDTLPTPLGTGEDPDEPILLPITRRELAALRAGTRTTPVPDTLGEFFHEWTARANTVSTNPHALTPRHRHPHRSRPNRDMITN